MARKTKASRDFELLIEAIGVEIAKDFSEAELKMLENTLYEALINSSNLELKKLREKVHSLPDFKKKYLETKLNIQPKEEPKYEVKEPTQPSFQGGL